MLRSLPVACALSLVIVGVAAADAESRDPVKAPPGQYELDKRHASLIVRVLHMGFSGEGRIKRSDFHVTGGRPFAGDTVDLQFDVEFVRKSPG